MRFRRRPLLTSRRLTYRIEELERRTLLSGVTVITHGFNSGTTGWVDAMALAIARRAGGLDHVDIETLHVTASGVAAEVSSVDHRVGTPLVTDSACNGQVILEVDWSSLDGLSGFPTVQVGHAVANYLVSNWASSPKIGRAHV